ncbi:MAG: Rid family detoxifying hydrolase [Candidatus Zixiibacteriota bacterium]
MNSQSIEFVQTDTAPSAIGPYSQAVKAGELLFISGQIPLDTETQKIVDDIEKATEIVLKNIENIVIEAGGHKENLVKLNVFMLNLNDFSKLNSVYAKFFDGHKPARAAIEVKRLPKDAIIEIEAIAYIK